VRRTAAVALLGLVVSVPGSGQGPAPVADDVQVYSAVVDATLRPKFRQRGYGSVVLLAGQTVPLCGAPKPQEIPCIRPDEMGRLRATSASSLQLFADGLVGTARTAITESFAARNSRSLTLPSLVRSDVLLLEPVRLAEESQRLSSPGASGLGGFSAPGYSRDGQAVVYAFYLCGNMCGYACFVLLDRGESGWRVQSTHLLWVS